MIDSDPVHFFDLDSAIPDPFRSRSPNTLKTRMVLNFKRIPYTQSWISYPDIAPLLKRLGVNPNDTGKPYTLPAICHKSVTSNPNGIMMDSLAIAMHLDKLYPSPPLFPSGEASYALLKTVGKVMGGMAPALRQLVPPKVPDKLDPRGKEYFIRTRTEALGKPLADSLPTDERVLRELWVLIGSQINTIILMLKTRPGKTGPFFEGDTPGYADLVLAANLAAFHNDDHELWEKMMALGDGELKILWDVCVPWITGQGEERECIVPRSTDEGEQETR